MTLLIQGWNISYKRKKKELQKLEKIQEKAIRRALGYQSSILINTMLAEGKEIRL
jgi:hypothetical protein